MSTESITYDLSAYAHLDQQWKAKPLLYLDRYFEKYFYVSSATNKRKHVETDAADEPENASNKISKEWQSIRLAHCHPLLDPAQSVQFGAITKVEFAESVRQSVIKGKGKKQSLRLMPDTRICFIHTTSGHVFEVRAAIKGVLMEWNASLELNPQLLTTSPDREGFVAIIKPLTDDSQKILSECVREVI
ncbi:hypothetical protein COEREDRAFT_5403 [Coemansia reversa NRRL 1564]|uniref:Actin-binding transcription modulator n=1 Tax=Coemansia reversa (strain ATCC 12441 / NRRL 1564) TaxID=763665 RepID=A0A2G5BKM8_COERN|nr:hypothetical protein COEREDRAFT_5403 [Coemansia reversa NRRL 1564]|eukprot:PIA19574.1 hypothetical protein COEREDRAFT_5403 [Coemansia reversa NRRL 1564]